MSVGDINPGLVWSDCAGWNWPKADGLAKICELPNSLGIITGLGVKRGQLIAETESGIPFIVPILKD